MELIDFLKIIGKIFIFNFLSVVYVRSHSLKIYLHPTLNADMVEMNSHLICTRIGWIFIQNYLHVLNDVCQSKCSRNSADSVFNKKNLILNATSIKVFIVDIGN